MTGSNISSRYMSTSHSLPQRFLEHVQRARLFRSAGGGTTVVAVSGGPDSVALLDLLTGVAPTLGLELVVAHADHGIQPDSRFVGLTVRDLAATLKLPFELGELNLGPQATETVARRARYAWLREVQRQRAARYLVTAHHRDDQIETVLLRVLRGSAARRAGLPRGPARARDLVALARRPSGRLLPLGDGWTAEVSFDRLRVAKDATVGCALERVLPAGERGSARFGGFEITWSPGDAPPRIERSTWTTWVDGAEWEVRPPAPGDSVAPLGGVGHRPLRRLLMEARVPRSARPGYPVVARGETILWVPGICRSADGLPAPGTRAVRLDVTEYRSAPADRRS